MLSTLFVAWCLMAACVATHAIGVTAAGRKMQDLTKAAARSWMWTLIFIRLAGWMIFLHLFEIAIWAVFYTWQGAMPDFQSAVYFSAVTYTTTGYGDLVLPAEWRLVGAVEALTGILMCGWSSAFFFAVVTRAFDIRRA
jgi:voltage-gated potassium channel Kch